MARYNTSQASKVITGTTTIVTPDSGSFVQLAGTSGYTVTLPAPAAFPGSNFTFYNATNGTVTLSTPSGAFNGTGGSGASTVSIFSGNVISLTSDGTNYIVISEDGSPLIATTGSFSSNVDVNGTLTVNPSGGVSMSPSTVGSINNVTIGGTTRAAGSFTALTANGATTFTANTPSTTSSSGTVVITGGLGVTGTINAASVSANLTGTIQTASQPNITSVGALTGLTVDATTLVVDTVNKRVGISTSSPTNKFQVSGNGARMVSQATTDTGEVQVEAQVFNYWPDSGAGSPTYTGTAIQQFGAGATGTTAGISNAGLGVLRFQNGNSGLIYTNGGSPIIFATTGTERMRILPGGAVGIGTATAGKKLTISRTTETTSEQIELRNEGGITNGNFDGIVWTQGATGSTTLSSIRLNYNNSGQPDMAFNLRSQSNVLFLRNGGNVGVNTSSPSHTLHVVNNNNVGNGAGGTIFLDRLNNASYENAVNFGTAGTRQWFLGQDNDSTENLHLYNWSSGQTIWTATSDGIIRGAHTDGSKAYTFVRLTTPKTWTSTFTGQPSGSFTTTSTLGLPAGIKALSCVGYYHVTGYSSGWNDHALSQFGPRAQGGGTPWSFNTSTDTEWGSYTLEHDGDASGAPHYYGAWNGVGLINVGANDTVFYTLGRGYSGGTHYNSLWIWGYWI